MQASAWGFKASHTIWYTKMAKLKKWISTSHHWRVEKPLPTTRRKEVHVYFFTIQIAITLFGSSKCSFQFQLRSPNVSKASSAMTPTWLLDSIQRFPTVPAAICSLEAQSQENRQSIWSFTYSIAHIWEQQLLECSTPNNFSAWNLKMGCSLSEKEAALQIHQRLTGRNMTWNIMKSMSSIILSSKCYHSPRSPSHKITHVIAKHIVDGRNPARPGMYQTS